MDLRKGIVAVVAFSAVLLLSSCGGGGGTTAVTQDKVVPETPQATPPSLSKYVGQYAGGCSLIDGAGVVESGAPIYEKVYFSVAPLGLNSTKAKLTLRLDFFTDAACSGGAVGSITASNAIDGLTALSDKVVSGVSVLGMRINVPPFSFSYSASSDPKLVILEDVVRLRLPADYLEGGPYQDIWYLEGNSLYFGGLNYGADGFPSELDKTGYFEKIGLLPPPIETPCPKFDARWSESGNLCTAPLAASASGAYLTVASTRIRQELHRFPVATGSGSPSVRHHPSVETLRRHRHLLAQHRH
jgi:hypothetical protein